LHALPPMSLGARRLLREPFRRGLRRATHLGRHHVAARIGRRADLVAFLRPIGICYSRQRRRERAHPCAEGVPLEALAFLGCGMQTGAGSILNELRPPVGASVAVSGTGAVGLAAIMAARAASAATIVAIDIHDVRLALAKELGATHTINARSADTAKELLRITADRGMNYILDTTAVPKVLVSLAGALAIRGTLALVGAARPGTEAPFEIGASLVRGWTFKTIVQGSSVPQDFIPRLVGLWRQGLFPVEKLTRTYRLADINDAFADSASGVVVKPVIVF